MENLYHIRHTRKGSCTIFSLLPVIDSVTYASRKGDNKVGGASAFFGNVSQGIKTSLEFVEGSPTLRNLSQDTQQFASERISNVVKEIG